MIKVNLSEYFQIIKPKYIILKITPDKSIRNYNSSVIAKSIQIMYKPIYQRLNKIKKEFKFTYKEPEKCCFIIDIIKSSVEFYFLVPQFYENLFREKLSEVWPKATVQTVNILPKFSKECVKYQLCYSKEDALSLNTDKRCNEPLNSILNILDILNEGDHVGIYYNFMPAYQKGWRKIYDTTINKLKAKEPVDREKLNLNYALKEASIITADLLDYVLNLINSFFGGKEKEKMGLAEIALSSLVIDDIKKISNATLNKKDQTILNTQQLILFDSKDKISANNNAVTLCETFKTLSEDNELIFKKINKDINPFDYSLPADINKMSTVECQSFLEIPGRELLGQYKGIKKVNVLESQVPQLLQSGYMELGKNKYKDTFTTAYLPSDKLYGNLPVTFCGPEGSGKTTVLARKVFESYKNNEAAVVIDYIKNNELSEKIIEIIPKENLVIINCGKNEDLQGLGYNEIQSKSENEYDILDCSSMQSEQDVALIDSCNSEPLSGRMLKYFLAAANVIHLHKNKTLSNVLECLENYVKRDEYIKFVESNEIYRSDLAEEILTLRELDDIGKDGKVIGTKYSQITFIQDRIIKLKSNRRLKHMYSKSCEENINLVNEIEANKIILIMMPQLEFGTPLSKNICATYFISKLWLVAQIRGTLHEDPNRVNIIIDELYQVPVAEQLIGNTLEQARKFGNRYLFSCHNFNQLEIAPILKSEGSYIFFHGCDISNYTAFKAELLPYEYEDMANLQEFCTLNLIKYKGGYTKFITHLPPPIK